MLPFYVSTPFKSLRLTPTISHLAIRISTSSFSTSFHLFKKSDPLPPRPTLPDEVLTKKFLKGSGPGGQKINKTSSAVQLTHLPTGIVVKSQATRSRTQNEHIAKRILAEKIEFIEKGSESRIEKKRERASRKKRSAEKKSRRKYKRLAEGKTAVGTGSGGEKKGGDYDENEDGEEDGDGIDCEGEAKVQDTVDGQRDMTVSTSSTNLRSNPG